MVAWLDELIKEQDRGARDSHANWDSALFQRLCQDLARPLCERLKATDPSLTAQSYLSLLQEAILCGYLKSWDSYGYRPKTVLQYFLTVLIPDGLAAKKPAGHPAIMAQLWNIGEAFYQEPPWLNQYVLSRMPELKNLNKVEDFLKGVLDPVLKPIKKSEWRGPFKVTQVNTRSVDDQFLPGEMILTGPSVLLIKDRERKAQLTLLLQKEGRSQLLGSSQQGAGYVEEFEPPKLQFRLGTLSIGSQSIDLPLLDVREESCVTESGFVVVSAVDSQLLWVVESP
ncbi:MAG: hypothetical protein P1V97_38910 [Planctomycetota bacterium]|nr:hypothetical protein [Planctomycetota bacterium]